MKINIKNINPYITIVIVYTISVIFTFSLAPTTVKIDNDREIRYNISNCKNKEDSNTLEFKINYIHDNNKLIQDIRKKADNFRESGKLIEAELLFQQAAEYNILNIKKLIDIYHQNMLELASDYANKATIASMQNNKNSYYRAEYDFAFAAKISSNIDKTKFIEYSLSQINTIYILNEKFGDNNILEKQNNIAKDILNNISCEEDKCFLINNDNEFNRFNLLPHEISQSLLISFKKIPKKAKIAIKKEPEKIFLEYPLFLKDEKQVPTTASQRSIPPL